MMYRVIVRIIIFCSSVIIVGSCSTVREIADPAIVNQKIVSGALIVDVRTINEFESGHYKGAVNIPLSDLSVRLSELGGKDTPIVIYCKSGKRASMAKAILESNGFKDVTNAGGFSDMPKEAE